MVNKTHGINNNRIWNKIMNAKKKLATLSLIALGAFGSLKAQSSNDNLLAFNGASKTTNLDNNDLTAPVVKKGESGYDALVASRKGNLAIIVHRSKKDKLSGERYAQEFAKGFSNPKMTDDKPMYITAVYTEINGTASTYFEVFMDGQLWDYKDQAQFLPSDAKLLAPIIMKDFVKEHGNKKILPLKVFDPSNEVTMN